MEISVKRILEIALVIDRIPEGFESDAQRTRWFMENLGKVTFEELDAAGLLHRIAEGVRDDANNRINRKR